MKGENKKEMKDNMGKDKQRIEKHEKKTDDDQME